MSPAGAARMGAPARQKIDVVLPKAALALAAPGRTFGPREALASRHQ